MYGTVQSIGQYTQAVNCSGGNLVYWLFVSANGLVMGRRNWRIFYGLFLGPTGSWPSLKLFGKFVSLLWA